MSKPQISYLVCSVPRSGSTLLCDLLVRTGVAGSPGEFFSPYTVGVLKERWGCGTLDDYVHELVRRETGPNGVFGAKVHWAQYEATLADADLRALLPNVRLAYITRRDRLRQAVSWVRAQQTGKFHADDPARVDSAVFDRDQITRMVRRVEHEERRWESTFEQYSIEPHRVVYEDLVADREATVRGMLDMIGVAAPADLHIPPPGLERQADEISDEWVARYLAETATSREPAPGGA